MKKLVLFLVLATFLASALAQAATIQYMGTGRNAPKVKVTFSRNNGVTWEHKDVRPGQTFNIPKDATNLLINNSPYDPSKSYKVKDGNVS